MKRLALGSILASMALGLLAVKTRAKDLPSANKAGLKDSVNDTRSDWPRFVRAVIGSGEDFNFVDGFAQAIGLSEPSVSKSCHVTISGQPGIAGDDHTAYVIYSAASSGQEGRHPTCVYLMRGHSTKRELKMRFYRFSLDGHFEQAITLQNKREDGKDLPETRARFEEDIQNPEIQKAFKTEMSYWLKDWLKKQHLEKNETANANEAVREHAKTAQKETEHEAATVPAPASTSP